MQAADLKTNYSLARVCTVIKYLHPVTYKTLVLVYHTDRSLEAMK